MKYCHHCATELTITIPLGDDRERHYCVKCDAVFYQNPKNVVGTLPVWEDKVLLCKRAIDPRRGLWTLPAGFMENGETSLDGAIRETREEAGAEVVIEQDALYTLFNLPRINQVYLFFRAALKNADFQPGYESEEVRLFSEDEIPWREIAFPVVKSTLENYFDDRKTQHFPVRMFNVHHGENRQFDIQLISRSPR